MDAECSSHLSSGSIIGVFLGEYFSKQSRARNVKLDTGAETELVNSWVKGQDSVSSSTDSLLYSSVAMNGR